MRVLVCGSRHWTDKAAIRAPLSEFKPGDVVIHGGQVSRNDETLEFYGADYLASAAAIELGLGVEVYPADWDRYGKAAGPIRNQEMIDYGKPDCGLAFPLPGSRGTWDMIRRLRKAGIPVRILGAAK